MSFKKELQQCGPQFCYCFNGMTFFSSEVYKHPRRRIWQLGPSVSYWQDLVSIALTQKGLQPQAHSMYRTFGPGQSRWNHATPNTGSWLPLTRVSGGLLQGKQSCLPSDPCTEAGQSSVWPTDSSPCSGGPDASPRSCHLNSHPFLLIPN